jgi:hypothetical protein
MPAQITSFSSEAYDYYGLEPNKTYDLATPLQVPDSRDWEIIECLATDYVGVEDFPPEEVERVEKMVMITDEEYKKLVADGHIKPEDLETEKAKNQQKTEGIFEVATTVSYQLSNGTLRIDGDDLVGLDLRDAPDAERPHVTAAPTVSASSPVVADASAHQRVFEDFLRAVAARSAPCCDGRGGRQSVELVEAIYQSARENRPIDLARLSRGFG